MKGRLNVHRGWSDGRRRLRSRTSTCFPADLEARSTSTLADTGPATVGAHVKDFEIQKLSFRTAGSGTSLRSEKPRVTTMASLFGR